MRIKDARLAAGLTQKQLAEKAGLNIRAIQKYESGECAVGNMTLAAAAGIAKALKIKIEKLLEE